MRKIIGIVDDNPTMLDSVDGLLRASGYETELFSSGEALVDAITTSHAVCLVVDIQLGGISGIELARHLAALGSTLPVIFMTGAVDRTIESAALETGCVAFLRKPFPAHLLVGAIEQALQPVE
jgi:FixJ family two-component response regulator